VKPAVLSTLKVVETAEATSEVRVAHPRMADCGPSHPIRRRMVAPAEWLVAVVPKRPRTTPVLIVWTPVPAGASV
jgi:hypothetical protein